MKKSNRDKYKKYCLKISLLKGGNPHGSLIHSSNLLPYSLPISRKTPPESSDSSRRSSVDSVVNGSISRNLYTSQLDENLSFDINNIVCCVANMGKGSHAEVHKGIDKTTGRTVIIKKIVKNSKDMALNGNSLTYENCKKQIQTEINLLSSMKNQNIIKCYGHNEHEKNVNNYKEITFEIYMEDVCGYNLASIAKNMRGIELGLMSLFMTQVLNGLQYLHSSKIIHMDIKGENVLLSNTGIIKLIDFGESVKIDQNNITPYNLQYRGSSLHIAPEIRDSPNTYYKAIHLGKSDIWSFGVMLIELFVGNDYNNNGINVASSTTDIIRSILKNLFFKISKILKEKYGEQIIEYDSIDDEKISIILMSLLNFPEKICTDTLCFLCFVKLCINPNYTLRKSAAELLTDKFISQPSKLEFDADTYFFDLEQFYTELFNYEPIKN